MNHVPVLLQEVIAGLDLHQGLTVVDGTLDGGGHAREIIPRIMPGGIFVGIDWDAAMVDTTRMTIQKEFAPWRAALHFVHANYAQLPDLVASGAVPRPDRLLIDLGFSSHQINDPARGMSFQTEGPLDMRYDQSNGPSAADIVNGATAKELADVLWQYGEERFSRQIAQAIVDARRKEHIETTGGLAAIVAQAVPGFYRRGKINPATKTFQALRIAVNRELDNVTTLLEALPSLMAPGGRVAVISFHSLEDRLVKDYFRRFVREGRGSLVSKKPIVPLRQEAQQNPRSRSAKLRILIVESLIT
ncbi:MAG: 16S rRNA (cytosine(1402)-N(4))-methyltransferase RsmH [Candidatus Paceibacterota bacterium]|jgi:16S rRNA (cytosine1402-N4)-methyltransferase